MSDLEILFHGGPRDGERRGLVEGVSLVIGRDATCSLQLLDSRLSRKHASLERTKAGVVLRDLGSTNGTFLNGQRVAEAYLTEGDVIRLGSTELELEPSATSDEPITLVDDGPSFGFETISHRFEEHEHGIPGCVAEDLAVKDDGPTYARLRTLITISALLNTSLELPRLLQDVIDQVRQLFKADRGCLVVARGRDMVRHFSYASGWESSSWVLSKTIFNQAMKQGMSVISADARDDADLKSGASIAIQAIKSVMCVPVLSRDEVLGVIYLDTVGAVQPYSRDDLELLSAVGRQTGLALKREIAKEEKELLFLDTIRAVVAAIEAKDSYTAGHSARVADYSQTLGTALQYNEYFVDRLRYAAHLHDVGKIGIPERILNKPERLTTEEYGIIRSHPVIGARILENIRNIEDVIEGVRHHHERYDGGGYPDGLEGEDIPLISRVISVADAFDAMTSDRAYRKAMTIEAAIAEFEGGSGTQFEAALVVKMTELLRGGLLTPIKTTLKVF